MCALLLFVAFDVLVSALFCYVLNGYVFELLMFCCCVFVGLFCDGANVCLCCSPCAFVCCCCPLFLMCFCLLCVASIFCVDLCV